MRILYLHLYDAAYGIGGAEKVVSDLALAMRDHYGHEIHCLINEGSLRDSLLKRNVSVDPIPYAKWRTPELAFGLMAGCRFFQPHMIHSHHRFTTFLADVLLKRNAPVIHTEHVMRRSRKAFFRPGTVAAAVHESVAENLRTFYGVPPEAVRCIPNGIAKPESDAAGTAALRGRFPSDGKTVNFLCVGRLEQQKGHTYLLRAVAALPQNYRDRVRIFLAGNGSLERRLRSEAESLGVSDRFIFAGHAQRVGDFYELCDVFVLPSLWEGLPLSVLEAFSMKRPVIATDISGTNDLVRHDITGCLVKARDPGALAKGIQELMDDPAKRQRLAQAGFALWEKRYSLSRMAADYDRLYREIAGKA